MQVESLAGIVDLDPRKVGSTIGEIEVRGLADLAAIVKAGCNGSPVSIGVVATPAAAAQDAADLLVAAGVTSILNFAPVLLAVPTSVTVRKVDLAVELQILSYYEQRRAAAAAAQLQAVSAGSGRNASA